MVVIITITGKEGEKLSSHTKGMAMHPALTFSWKGGNAKVDIRIWNQNDFQPVEMIDTVKNGLII
ncbi:MAG: hypothetical protein LBT43_19345 [Prevotella sp.]|jgi:hypothetical protein|nr:hypothetical protein [Prevotella sp.]